MRTTHQWRLALGLVLFGVAAGCRTLPRPPPLVDGGLVSSPTLSSEQERMAQAHAYYSIGIHHEILEEYPQAYEAYRQAADLDPNNERLILRLASTLVLQRKTEDALRAVEEFLNQNPTSEAALLWLATFYGTTGDSERVVQLFEQMTRQFPDKPIGWLQLAAMASKSNPVDASIKILEKGLSQAIPPTTLRQELVRLHLQRMKATTDPEQIQEARQAAITLLRQLTKEEPGDIDALYPLGDLLVEEQQMEDAIRVYKKIERLQPDDLRAKQRLARTFLAMDDPPQAIAVLETLAENGPEASNIHYDLGEIYLQAGDYTKAAEQFRMATEESPDDPSPWLKLAAIQAETNDTQAVATLKEGLEQVPDNPKLLEVLGLVRLGQKRYTQAARLMQQVYEAVIAEDPEAIPSNLFFYNYALICTHLRQTQDAAGWLLRAIEQEPALLELYMQRTMTGTLTFRTAATRVLRALSALPSTESAAIHAHLGTLYLAQEKPKKAIRAFEKALKITQSEPLQASILTPRFHFWFGVALDQEDQLDRAVEQFETCIRLDPSYADALNYLAYLWANHGIRLEDASTYIQTALDLDPGNAAYLDTFGWVRYQQGEYKQAIDLLLQADQIRPDDPEILEHIAKVREALSL